MLIIPHCSVRERTAVASLRSSVRRVKTFAWQESEVKAHLCRCSLYPGLLLGLLLPRLERRTFSMSPEQEVLLRARAGTHDSRFASSSSFISLSIAFVASSLCRRACLEVQFFVEGVFEVSGGTGGRVVFQGRLEMVDVVFSALSVVMAERKVEIELVVFGSRAALAHSLKPRSRQWRYLVVQPSNLLLQLTHKWSVQAGDRQIAQHTTPRQQLIQFDPHRLGLPIPRRTTLNTSRTRYDRRRQHRFRRPFRDAHDASYERVGNDELP